MNVFLSLILRFAGISTILRLSRGRVISLPAKMRAFLQSSYRGIAAT